jgi:aminopeptidase N
MFGPYPYEKLAHLQSSTRFGGMENASAIFYSDRAFRNNGVSYGLLAHETAHQWFGDAVTEREWSHAWLSEGFATYLAALYTHKSRGDSAFRVQMRGTRETVLNAPVVANRPVIDTIETSLMALLNANSYQKGGWVLHMLRDEVGDSAFFQGVRTYQARHRHSTALSDDLRVAIEAYARKDLKPFFAQWLTRPGYPELQVAWKHDAAKGQLIATIAQGGRFGNFAFPLTVEYTGTDGVTKRARVQVPAQASGEVVVATGVRAAPTRVRFDPDVQLLARISER